MSQQDARYHNGLGESLMAAHPMEAISHFATAIDLGASEPNSYFNLSALLLGINQPEDALKICALGLEVCGEEPGILCNQGVAFARLGFHEEALARFQRQAALVKPQARPWANMGNVFVALGRLEEAKYHLKKAIQLNPNDRGAHLNLSLTLLLEGNYPAGFREYEMREALATKSRFRQPIWQGERLYNKRILITHEQGAGDVIQFARYAPLVEKRGGQVILEIPKSLGRLFAWSEKNFETVIAGDHDIAFDVQCPLLSLPYRCRTDRDTIPPPQRLSVPTEMRLKWAAIMGETYRPRVAVVWSGTPTHANDANRSLPLSELSALFQYESVCWHSLQVGAGASQIASSGLSDRILDLSPLLTDFAETAGALSQMDLSITVDTSMAHLAGTLQVPVWTLLPFAPDWRWLLNREDSPWYPSMRLFRQPAPRNWKSVIDAVALELTKRF